MIIRSLTVSEVKGAKSTGKPYSLYDGFGLVLYVSAVGGKVWRYRYSHPVTKKRQTFTIGSFPEFTLSEAREKRDELKRLLVRGFDPCEEKKKEKAEKAKKYLQTFQNIAEKWMEFKKSGNLRPKSILNMESIVNNYIIPIFGKTAIHDINAPMVISSLERHADKSNTLMRVISTLNEIMNFSVNSGVINTNPLLNIKNAFNAKKAVSLPALPVDELPAFINWWESSVSVFQRAALVFQILTMVRPNEAFQAEWKEINFDAREWTLPESKIKTKCEHVVPLSSQALMILEEMKKYKKGEYIFQSATKGNPIPRRTISKAISQGPFGGRVTPHGFRSMWSTLLNEEGFNPDVIEAALAHKNGNAIRNIYNRTTYLEQRRIMMQWVGDFLDSARRGVVSRSGGRKGLMVVNE